MLAKVQEAKKLDRENNYVCPGPGRRHISALAVIMETEEIEQPQAPVNSVLSVTSTTTETEQAFRNTSFSELKQRVQSGTQGPGAGTGSKK